MIERNFGGRRVQLVGSYKRLDELADNIKAFSYRVLKEDCLDLPPKVFTTRTVELSDEQKEKHWKNLLICIDETHHLEMNKITSL